LPFSEFDPVDAAEIPLALLCQVISRLSAFGLCCDLGSWPGFATCSHTEALLECPAAGVIYQRQKATMCDSFPFQGTPYI